MDIWITTCRRTAKCNYCNEDITLNEPVVRGRLWQRSNENSKPLRWVKQFRWHAKRVTDSQCCWLAQALDHLSSNPPVEHRGRKQLDLPAEVRERRLALLRQRARLVQRMKFIVLADIESRDLGKIMIIGNQIEELRAKMIEAGGVPKSWE